MLLMFSTLIVPMPPPPFSLLPKLYLKLNLHNVFGLSAGFLWANAKQRTNISLLPHMSGSERMSPRICESNAEYETKVLGPVMDRL